MFQTLSLGFSLRLICFRHSTSTLVKSIDLYPIQPNKIKPIIIYEQHPEFQRYLLNRAPNLTNFLTTQVNAEELLECISCLKHTASYYGLTSLAANQIGMSERVFVILNREFIRGGKWNSYHDQSLLAKQQQNAGMLEKNDQEPIDRQGEQEEYDEDSITWHTTAPQLKYTAFVNPEIVSNSQYKIKSTEESASVEGLIYKIWVPAFYRAKYFRHIETSSGSNKSDRFNKTKQKPTQLFIQEQSQLSGFYGRVFDHSYRQLEGLMINNFKINTEEVYLSDTYRQDPGNYMNLKVMRLQMDWFKEGNIKNIAKNEQKHQRGKRGKIKQTLGGNGRGEIDFDMLTDKISPEMREQLAKGFEKMNRDLDAKQEGNKRMNQGAHATNKNDNRNPNRGRKVKRK